MRLKDVAILNPKYDGENLYTELVSFSPMECLRYDNLRPYTIPFKDAKGKYTYFANNDVLFAKVTPCFENLNTAIASNLLNGIGFGSSEINVLRFSDKCYTRYFFYLICSRQFIDKGCASMSGVGGLKRINPLVVTTFEFELPPRLEQEAIADYLDKECDKITREIDLLERKVDCYRRLRRSLINRAVTRGLDPNIPLKPSGSDWIGDIPQHWNLKPLRNFITLISPEKKGLNDYLLLSVTRDRGVIVRGERGEDGNNNRIPEDLSNYKVVHKNQFVVNKMKAWMGSYGVSDFDGIVSPAYYICSVHDIYEPFFSLAIRCKMYTNFFWKYSKGIRVDQWDMSPLALKEIPFVTPPKNEQKEITEYLDEKCGKIDSIIKKIESKIERLRALKRSLINEVITGQRTIKTSDL